MSTSYARCAAGGTRTGAEASPCNWATRAVAAVSSSDGVIWRGMLPPPRSPTGRGASSVPVGAAPWAAAGLTGAVSGGACSGATRGAGRGRVALGRGAAAVVSGGAAGGAAPGVGSGATLGVGAGTVTTRVSRVSTRAPGACSDWTSLGSPSKRTACTPTTSSVVVSRPRRGAADGRGRRPGRTIADDISGRPWYAGRQAAFPPFGEVVKWGWIFPALPGVAVPGTSLPRWACPV